MTCCIFCRNPIFPWQRKGHRGRETWHGKCWRRWAALPWLHPGDYGYPYEEVERAA